ncbi:hypothetical protein FIBSPDRAFT_900956 [Athelia psychrophila]|uniref:Uncharacterized protein n=1 Tax=Athelia psychrophila TaxID=1759441 RepID=A0A165XQQ2_9AGAM|nr:hypothetical protein FIBSPDRAFT_900956 [Fibularhizoctonia sp. CBS 109695]
MKEWEQAKAWVHTIKDCAEHMIDKVAAHSVSPPLFPDTVSSSLNHQPLVPAAYFLPNLKQYIQGPLALPYTLEQIFNKKWVYWSCKRCIVALYYWLFNLEWEWGTVSQLASSFELGSAHMKEEMMDVFAGNVLLLISMLNKSTQQRAPQTWPIDWWAEGQLGLGNPSLQITGQCTNSTHGIGKSVHLLSLEQCMEGLVNVSGDTTDLDIGKHPVKPRSVRICTALASIWPWVASPALYLRDLSDAAHIVHTNIVDALQITADKGISGSIPGA